MGCVISPTIIQYHITIWLIPYQYHIDTITSAGANALSHLVAIVVHGHQAQQMVNVPTLAKLAHHFWLYALVLQDTLVAR